MRGNALSVPLINTINTKPNIHTISMHWNNFFFLLFSYFFFICKTETFAYSHHRKKKSNETQYAAHKHTMYEDTKSE